jgi:hypothetical protein
MAHRIRLTRYLNIAREITYLFVETRLRSAGEELEKSERGAEPVRFDAPLGDPLVEDGSYLRQRAAMSTE